MTEHTHLLDRLLDGTFTDEDRQKIEQLNAEGKLGDITEEYIAVIIERQKSNPVQIKADDVKAEVWQKLKAEVDSQKRSVWSSTISYAAAAMVTLVALVGIWMYLPHKTKDQPTVSTVTFSKKGYYRLADNSKIYLNDGGTLTYTDTDSTREVVLSGEAYFDVAHDPGKPFKVNANNFTTRVLGTAFNIKAFKDKPFAINVSRGKVKVSDTDSHFTAVLTIDQSFTYNPILGTSETKVSDKAEIATAWTNDFFVIDNLTLEETAKLIEERFKVKVSFASDKLKACDLNAEFHNNEPLTEIMNSITVISNTSYTVDDAGNVTIAGYGCQQ